VPQENTERNVTVFGATSLLNDTASEMSYWLIPSFLMSLGAGPATLGLIEGIAESVASLAKLYSGYLADRAPRRKPIVVAGYAVANLMKPLLALATSWWHVLFIRFADRLAKGFRGAPRDVMLSESVPRERLGGAFGVLQSMDTAGAIVGPLLALLLLRHYAERTVFWFAAIPGLLSVLVIAFGVRETSGAQPATAGNATTNAPGTRLPRSYYYVLFVVTLFSLGGSSDMFLILRAQNMGIPAAAAPLLGLVFNIVYSGASWPLGALSDRVSKHGMAAAGYAVYAIVYSVFALAPARSAIWGAMAFYGLYYALTDPVLRALVAQTVPAAQRGRAFGIYYFATSLATLAASLIAGELWSHIAPHAPFYFAAAIAGAAAVLMLFCRE